MDEAIRKAEVLVEALAWIRRFRGRHVVIKLGGSALEETEAVRSFLTDVIFLQSVGLRPILVHGGGKDIDKAMATAGITPRKVQGRRYTDAATLEIVAKVLAGDICGGLVDQIRRHGGNAIGLSFRSQLADFFRGLYPNRWSQAAVAEALATIPTLMMWDDHDIMDGWGSYEKKLHECDVYGAIFASAKETFALYQQQIGPGESHPLVLPGQPHFSFGCRIGPLAILALDMRSERTEAQVMGPQSWKAVYDWLDALPKAADGGPKHLFIMSSIPVVYPDFSMLEAALGIFPGRQELEDDLKDHWTSVPHRQERLRMIHRLLDFSAKNACRVTLLSGDVHVGAIGTVRSTRASADDSSMRVITQLTSSGIVHPAPPGMVLFFLENVTGKDMSDDRDISSEIVEIPGTRNHFIGARNWLALAPDAEHRYWANWHAENLPYPFTKAIHPADFAMATAKVKPPEN